MNNQGKPKKPFYKKWWFWVIVAVIAIGAIGGNGSDSKTAKKEETKIEKKADTKKSTKVDAQTENKEPEKKDITDGMDVATKNAYRSAKNYLNFKGFSKQGLIEQLSSEYGDGYTVDQATAAVQAIEDAGEVDWNEQAVKAGKNYLDFKGFSRQGLIEQLTSDYGDKFTVEQATYAVDQLGL
jgi:hypothetical protein